MKCVISIGANIGQPQENVNAAINLLSKEFANFQQSKLYLTKPVGYLDQPDFTNAVVIGNTKKSPYEVLKFLQQIEEEFGRQRDIKWGPRTLDLDLIDCGLIMLDEVLTLPHPRASERKFVLEPWFELEPDGVLTGIGPIKDLLANLS